MDQSLTWMRMGRHFTVRSSMDVKRRIGRLDRRPARVQLTPLLVRHGMNLLKEMAPPNRCRRQKALLQVRVINRALNVLTEIRSWRCQRRDHPRGWPRLLPQLTSRAMSVLDR